MEPEGFGVAEPHAPGVLTFSVTVGVVSSVIPGSSVNGPAQACGAAVQTAGTVWGPTPCDGMVCDGSTSTAGIGNGGTVCDGTGTDGTGGVDQSVWPGTVVGPTQMICAKTGSTQTSGTGIGGVPMVCDGIGGVEAPGVVTGGVDAGGVPTGGVATGCVPTGGVVTGVWHSGSVQGLGAVTGGVVTGTPGTVCPLDVVGTSAGGLGVSKRTMSAKFETPSFPPKT